jgi:transposase
VHRELKRKHVTLVILWDEYAAANPGGYSYSRFCELYRAFEKTLSVTMRQTHAAGERLFVDYTGDGVPVVIDRLTGEIRMAQIFVAVLGASSFTFARATWTQALPDWIDAHVRAFEAIGGVPELVVPDNAKTAVVKASFYDPQVNRTYAEMAAHYRTAILPARPRKPRDKAKVEQAVLIVERWLLGRLRRRIFRSLADVDAALDELMTQLNERQPLRRLGVTRRQLLEEVDRPALKAMPDEPYEYSEWRLPRVGLDYHVDIDAHYYSVPYRFARAEVETRLTARADVGMEDRGRVRWALWRGSPIEFVVEDGFDGAICPGADLDGALGGGLEARRAEGAGEANDAETGAVALLGMGPALEDLLAERRRPRADLPGVLPDPLDRPAGVAPVARGHVLGDGGVLPVPARPDIDGDALAFVENLDAAASNAATCKGFNNTVVSLALICVTWRADSAAICVAVIARICAAVSRTARV